MNKKLPIKTAVFGTTQVAQIAYGRKLNTYIGGNGLLSALAVAKQESVYLISAIGSDVDRKYLRSILPKNLSIELLESQPGETFYLSTDYDPIKQEVVYKNIEFGVHENYMPDLSNYDVTSITKLHLSGTDPDKSIHLLKQLDTQKIKILSADCLMYFLEKKFTSSMELFQHCQIIFTNKQEYEFIQSKINQNIFTLFNKLELIVVTLGKNGVRYISKTNTKELKIPKNVMVENPANAGDVLAGIFISYLNPEQEINEQNIDQMLNTAQKEAAKVITNNNYYRIKYEAN